MINYCSSTFGKNTLCLYWLKTNFPFAPYRKLFVQTLVKRVSVYVELHDLCVEHLNQLDELWIACKKPTPQTTGACSYIIVNCLSNIPSFFAVDKGTWRVTVAEHNCRACTTIHHLFRKLNKHQLAAKNMLTWWWCTASWVVLLDTSDDLSAHSCSLSKVTAQWWLTDSKWKSTGKLTTTT